MTAPGYWMRETSGVLRPAVEAYLRGEAMTAMQIAAMRAYLRQWIIAPSWRGDGIEDLRRRVQWLTSRADIRAWLDEAEALGIDPL
jgi:hypothetical protein